MQQKQDTSLVWFRNDLRTQDNTVLQSALSTSRQVIGVYFLEPNMFKINKYGFKKMEKFRVKFLLETLNCLQQELHKLNITLLVYKDSAKDHMKHVVETHNISTIYLQKEWTDEENTTFNDVKDSLTKTVAFYEVYDQFLFHPKDIPFHFTDTPKVFTHFRKQLEKKAKVRSLIKTHPQRASFFFGNYNQNSHFKRLRLRRF